MTSSPLSRPTSPSLSSNTVSISDDLCGICAHIVTDNDKALICDMCDNWIHAKCNKMSDIQYEHHEINYEDIFRCRKCRTCGICDKLIASNQKFIYCDNCTGLVHIKCNKFDDKQHEKYLKQQDKYPTFCLNCNQENLPFLKLTDKQHSLTIYGIDYPEEMDINNLFLNKSQVRIVNKINNLMSQYSNNILDYDDDVPFIDCKYYSADSFKSMKFNSSKEFSILHLNIHSV